MGWPVVSDWTGREPKVNEDNYTTIWIDISHDLMCYSDAPRWLFEFWVTGKHEIKYTVFAVDATIDRWSNMKSKIGGQLTKNSILSEVVA